MSKYPNPLSISDRLTCLESDFKTLYYRVFREPSDSVDTKRPEIHERIEDILLRLVDRVDDLERRLGPSPDSKERKQQIAEAIDTPSDREVLQ